MAAFKSDHQILRDYIVAQDHLQYTTLPDGVVAVLMTHSNLPTKHLDIRLDLHSTIAQVKEKFRTHIGTPVEYQRLVLKSGGETICEMADDSRKLGFYSVASGNEIHIVDMDPFSLSRGGGLTDTSLVEKYRMADDAYDKRKGTMRDFIREKRRQDPNFSLKAKSAPGEPKKPAPGPESVESIKIGDRCECMPGARRGVVMFVGEIKEISAGGHWVGVRLDEPLGQNDGSVKGTVIFECPPGYGAFVRGENIKVGDYPERDELLDSDDDEANGKKDEEEDEI